MNEEQQRFAQLDLAPSAALNPEIATWLRLMRVHTRIIGRLTAFLRQWDLPMAQFDALAQIAAAEGICQQDLAERLMETKGNISRLLDRLMARGWLERRTEGHANRLYLTAAGHALACKVIPAQNALVTRLMATLPPADRVQLRMLLRQLEQKLHTDAAQIDG